MSRTHALPSAGEHLLCILPSDGHGGCEYNALSALVYFRERHGMRITASFPERPSTAFLSDLCALNGLPVAPIACSFEANDDAGRAARQRVATRDLIDRVRPSAVFLPLAWPKRGQGVIAGCADRGVPTVVKFALVPEAYDGAFVLPDARAALDRRQLWFANSRQSAGLIERHWKLAPRSVDSFHVGPIGLTRLLPQPEREPAVAVRDAVRAEFGFPAASEIAVVVARLAEQKGLRVLLDAADGVLAARPNLRLLLVGEGELRPAIERWRSTTRHGGRLTLAGFRSDVRRILRACDLFVLPTLYEGGCSQALLEALDEGLAVVASDVSAIAEIIVDGENGRLVAPHQPEALSRAILDVLGDPSLRERLEAGARSTAGRFTAERSFEETLLRLQRVSARYGLGGRGPAPVMLDTPLSNLSRIAIEPEAGSFGAGWHACERDPQGQVFRWMGHAGTVATNVLIDRPAVIALSGYSSLTPAALRTLQLEIDGQPLERLDDPARTESPDWSCRWRLDAATPRRAVLRFSSRDARRPKDLLPSNQDERWLSVAIRQIRIEAAV